VSSIVNVFLPQHKFKRVALELKRLFELRIDTKDVSDTWHNATRVGNLAAH
jgi:hypothetical protein